MEGGRSFSNGKNSKRWKEGEEERGDGKGMKRCYLHISAPHQEHERDGKYVPVPNAEGRHWLTMPRCVLCLPFLGLKLGLVQVIQAPREHIPNHHTRAPSEAMCTATNLVVAN